MTSWYARNLKACATVWSTLIVSGQEEAEEEWETSRTFTADAEQMCQDPWQAAAMMNMEYFTLLEVFFEAFHLEQERTGTDHIKRSVSTTVEANTSRVLHLTDTHLYSSVGCAISMMSPKLTWGKTLELTTSSSSAWRRSSITITRRLSNENGLFEVRCKLLAYHFPRNPSCATQVCTTCWSSSCVNWKYKVAQVVSGNGHYLIFCLCTNYILIKLSHSLIGKVRSLSWEWRSRQTSNQVAFWQLQSCWLTVCTSPNRLRLYSFYDKTWNTWHMFMHCDDVYVSVRLNVVLSRCG